MTETRYITTPIYYVNDRPHIGHVYTTTIADTFARFYRLSGIDTFFLTGTDEHAAKVVDSAAEHDMTAQQWADRNAASFRETFTKLDLSFSDFIRTSEDRHKTRVREYVQQLLDSGDIDAGEYEGWYDANQEEYVPENKAQQFEYKSPITGKPLARRKETNYFFRLSRYGDRLLSYIREHPTFIQPQARCNEVVARIEEGLNDVPISRSGAGGWGIEMPNDASQTIYVWIDALFNYLTAVDTDERLKYWPADVHFIAKDILWFHAVIWPALMMALDRPLPKQVYAHSFWIAEGQKMSKSLGNFIDLEKIDYYVEHFSLDALRYFLVSQGPMGATDADFSHDRFVETYNNDLANTLGNCASRVTNMVNRYFDGQLPARGPSLKADADHAHTAEIAVQRYRQAMEKRMLAEAIQAAMDLVRDIDLYIEQTQPFRLAKDESRMPEVATVLYNCAEALRIASIMLYPVLPNTMTEFWSRLGCSQYATALAQGQGDLAQWAKWGQLQPGTPITKGDPLFPRYQPE